MKKKKVTFGPHENVTPAGMDGVELAFPFTVVDLDHVGSPKEKSLTEERRVIVPIADTRRRGWHISDDDLPKVLFEYGRAFIGELIESDSLPSGCTIRMGIITTASHPGPCPFDFSLLPMPDGVTFDVEVHRKMGFKAGQNTTAKSVESN